MYRNAGVYTPWEVVQEVICSLYLKGRDKFFRKNKRSIINMMAENRGFICVADHRTGLSLPLDRAWSNETRLAMAERTGTPTELRPTWEM